MGRRVSVEEMSSAIMDGLQKYAGAAGQTTKACCKKVAKETVQELKPTSPKRTGKYAKGWKADVRFENSNSIRIGVHDAQYQLTHLLEKGHAKRGGRRVEGIEHIGPAEGHAVDKLLKELTSKL